MQLSQMKIGARARIRHVLAGEQTYRKRLISLGLLPGTELTLTKVMPLSDPVMIEVRGFTLTLRKNEAQLLELEEVRG